MASATIAGAGPKIIADAMKNVSEAEMSALTPGIFTAHAPAISPSAVKSSHSPGGGLVTSAYSEVKMVTAPKTITAPT